MKRASSLSLLSQRPWMVGLRITLASIVIGPWALALLMLSASDFRIPPQQALKEFVVAQVHFLFYGLMLFTAISYMRTRPHTSWVLKAVSFATIAFLASMASIWVCEWLGFDTADELALSVAHSMGIGVTISGVVLLIEWTYHRLVVTTRESERRLLERERALRIAAEARWSSLESRMRPHFIFNTLSSIRELMHHDVADADRMIERFAELLRFSLDAAGSAEVRLDEELHVVANYLAIEQMRFGERLRWSVDFPPALAAAVVPPLSVLTLAENAVKHAVSRRRPGGKVNVQAQRLDDALYVTVSDDGPGFSEFALKPGHGLDLIRQRLHLLFGARARVSIEARTGPEGGATVILAIPQSPQAKEQGHEPTSMLRGG